MTQPCAFLLMSSRRSRRMITSSRDRRSSAAGKF